MKILKHPVFYACVLLASLVYTANLLHIQLPQWIRFYLNDFLCMPIDLSLCLLVLRLIKKNETLYVPLYIILGLTLYFTLHFEWLMPLLSDRYTSDVIDIGLYFLGAMLFYSFQKRLF
jgi:hypothetical protein